MKETASENESREVYPDDLEEISRLFFYSQELLRRLNKLNRGRRPGTMTISQLKKDNELLKSSLAVMQKMLHTQTDY